MRILGTLTAGALLLAGVAIADETTLQSGEVTKHTTQSTTVQSNPGGQPEVSQESSTKVETNKHQATMDADGKDETQKDINIEKKSSTSTTAENPGATSQTYTESHHEQSSEHVAQ